VEKNIDNVVELVSNSDNKAGGGFVVGYVLYLAVGLTRMVLDIMKKRGKSVGEVLQVLSFIESRVLEISYKDWKFFSEFMRTKDKRLLEKDFEELVNAQIDLFENLFDVVDFLVEKAPKSVGSDVWYITSLIWSSANVTYKNTLYNFKYYKNMAKLKSRLENFKQKFEKLSEVVLKLH